MKGLTYYLVVLCTTSFSPCYASSFLEILQDLTGFGGTPTEEKTLVETPDVSPVAETDSIEELIIDVDQLSPSQNISTNGVLLHGLDKETAKVFAIKARVGEEILFGGLTVKVRHCEKTPADKRPESIAFLTISENKAGDESAPLFTGWMFSSSPSLSALDHPVYDVWVKNCIDLNPVP